MTNLLRAVSLVVLALTLPLLTDAQSRWEVIRLDRVSFAVPSSYKERDTLGQYSVHAKGDFSLMQVAKIPKPQAKIHDKQELINYYKLFQKLTIDHPRW